MCEGGLDSELIGDVVGVSGVFGVGKDGQGV